MYKNKIRSRSFEQIELNKEEVRQYLSEHNYKICNVDHRRWIPLVDACKHFNEWSDTEERITVFDFTHALFTIATHDYNVPTKETSKLVNGKQQKVLTNIYIKPTFKEETK